MGILPELWPVWVALGEISWLKKSRGSCKLEEFCTSKMQLAMHRVSELSQDTAVTRIFPLRHLLPAVRCLSWLLHTLSWGECWFSSQSPREGQTGLTRSTFWFSALLHYLPPFCLRVCFTVCCPLPAPCFFLSLHRMLLTPNILELGSGMFCQQTRSLSPWGNSSWWNPSYLAFQPCDCRHLHLSCIPSPDVRVKRGKQALWRCNSSRPHVDISIRSEPCSVSLHWL